MTQRVRKAHSKSRNGCLQCKKRHHKVKLHSVVNCYGRPAADIAYIRQCDECHPVCGQCDRLGTPCSLSQASPGPVPTQEHRALNIDDLRLLHHWHSASRQDDFAPFVDHAHVDRTAEYDQMIERSFRHPYLLHTLLALSALHMLHRQGATDSKLYQLASAHNLSAMTLARPQVARGDAEHRDAVYNFAAFSCLYATAEPPLRAGEAAIATDTGVITAILDAFKMGKGILAVQDPFVSPRL